LPQKWECSLNVSIFPTAANINFLLRGVLATNILTTPTPNSVREGLDCLVTWNGSSSPSAAPFHYC